MKKWTNDLNGHFFKEDIQMANNYRERGSMPLIIREMQIKTTTSYHFTPIRMTIVKQRNKSQKITNVGKDGEKS